MSPLSYNIPDAAAMLGGPFTVDWLKERVKRREVPFVKVGNGRGQGGRVGFTEDHLAQIVAMYTVTVEAPAAEVQPVTRRRSA